MESNAQISSIWVFFLSAEDGKAGRKGLARRLHARLRSVAYRPC